MKVPGVGPYIARARGLTRGRAASDLLYTFGGRGVQMLLGLAGSVISARALGPVDLGRFGLVMSTVTICGTLADAGLTYTAIKFIAQHNVDNEARSHATGRAYLLLRLCTGIAIALLGLLLSEPIALLVLGQPDLVPYLQLGFLTLFSLAFSSYPGTALVALALFRRLSIVTVLNAAITVAGILALALLDRLNLATLIAWNVILPLVSTLPAWVALPGTWLPWRSLGAGQWLPGRDVVKEVLSFSKWMMVSSLGSIIAAQGDLILLGRLAGPASVGVYSVALALALRLDMLNQSLLTVMLPRASRLRSADEVRSYSRRVARGSLALAGVLALCALLAQPLIVLLYGVRYTASAGLFLALAAVVLFDLATSSLFLVALPLNKPRVLAVADWLRVAALVVAGWLLIPAYKGYGAAASRFLSRVVGAAYTFYALRRASGPDTDPGEPEPAAATRWAS